MRLKRGEGDAGDAGDAIVVYPPEKVIMQDRLDHAQRLARRHIELQARQLAAELEVELRCRAKASQAVAQDCAKQSRLSVREATSIEERGRRLKERREHEAVASARARYLEWATAAERLHQQDRLEQRRYEAGLVRTAEQEHQAALRKERRAAMDERLQAHEAAIQRAREQKAAEFDAKLARIDSMEVRREEILDHMARLRLDAYRKYDEMKDLAYESTVKNNDDMLRRLLEELVPRLAAIPHTPRSTFLSPRRSSPRRAVSADSARRLDRSSSRGVRPSSARERSTGRAISLESPGRLVGIGGTARRRLFPVKQAMDKPCSDSRSTSTASLGNSGLLSASYGSASWESMSLPSPVGPQVSQLLANARGQLPTDTASTGASPVVPNSPIDCPLCYTTPRRPQRGIDMATYAKIARGMPMQGDDARLEDA